MYTPTLKTSTHVTYVYALGAFSLYEVYPATSFVLVISNRCGRLCFGYISTLVGLDRAQVACGIMLTIDETPFWGWPIDEDALSQAELGTKWLFTLTTCSRCSHSRSNERS